MGPYVSKTINYVIEHPEKIIDAVINMTVKLMNRPASKPAPMPTLGSNGATEETPAFWEEQRQEAHKQLGIDTMKAGKSTLINALRGIHKGEEGFAASSPFEETATIQSYRYKPGEADYLVLWDVPGWGGMKVPSATYFIDQKLFAFDFLFILSDGVLLEKDLEIAAEANKRGVPFSFVYTKCDISLEAICDEDNIQLSEKVKAGDFLRQGKAKFSRDFPSTEVPPLYFISSPVLLRPDDKAKYKLEEDKLLLFVSEKVSERRS